MSTHRDVDQHFNVFQNLTARADHYFQAGDYRAAAVYAEMAAAYATHHHPGLFVSYQLERILITIGREIANETFPEKRNIPAQKNSHHVLHMLSEAVGIGGPTRNVWRWIQQDTDSRHSVVITRQHEKVPPALKEAVKNSGGRIYRLNNNPGNILTWSQDLRRIAASVDIVILHTYPNDVIPLIAFADKRSMPPIALLNLSDHKFWLGASISDIVANQRNSGAKLAQIRRGIDTSRFGFVPIVVPSIPRTVSTAQAKAQIGLAQDTILLLSVARHNKYVPFRVYGVKFNDLVLPNSILPVLEKYPKSALIVVGLEFFDQWEQASQSVQGRISAVGRREDTAIFYQAADIYLDSFPFASITSCLEAGSFGLPLVGCNPFSEASAVLGADTPALENVMLIAKDKSEYISIISRLIEDPQERDRIGTDTQENITAVHMGDSWKGYVRELYRQAENTTPATVLENKEDQKTVSELDILSLDIDIVKHGEIMITQDHMRLLPANLRVKHWLQILKEYHVFRPSLLLSEWTAVQLIKARTMLREKWA